MERKGYEFSPTSRTSWDAYLADLPSASLDRDKGCRRTFRRGVGEIGALL